MLGTFDMFRENPPTPEPPANRKSGWKRQVSGRITTAFKWKRDNSYERLSTSRTSSAFRDPDAIGDTTKIVRKMEEAVIAVAISDDATMCAAGTVGAKIIIFSSADNSELASFKATSGISCITFCGRGSECSLVVGTFGGHLATYYSRSADNGEVDPENGKTTTFGNLQYVHSVAEARGGKCLVACGKAGLVTMYRVELRHSRACVLHELVVFYAQGDTRGVAIDQAASLVATGGDQKIVELWRTGFSSEQHIPTAPSVAACFTCKSQVHSVSLTANADHLAVGTSDSVEVFTVWIRSHSPESARMKNPLSQAGALVASKIVTGSHVPLASSRLSIRRSSSSSCVLTSAPAARRPSASFVKFLRLNSRPSAPEEQVVIEPTLMLHSHAHQGSVAFAQYGSILAIGGGFHINVVSLSSGGSLYTQKRSGRVRCVALSRSGERLVVGGFDHTVSMHVVGGGANVRRFDVGTHGRRATCGVKSSQRPMEHPPLQKENSSGGKKRGLLGRMGSAGRLPRRTASSEKIEVQQHQPSQGRNVVAVVRSIHLNSDCSRLAVGVDLGGQGEVQLYSTQQDLKEPLLNKWKHSKAVWVVRLSNDGALLAAGGYDCTVTLYNVVFTDRGAIPPLEQITFAATSGPAFIWSVTFSPDDRWLTIGCWNGETAVYRVVRGDDLPGMLMTSYSLLKAQSDPAATSLASPPAAAAAAEPSPPPSPPPPPPAADNPVDAEPPAAAPSADGAAPPAPRLGHRRSHGWNAARIIGRHAIAAASTKLMLAARVYRADRVYGVSLDEHGRHLVVGGREKMVAMYHLRAPRRVKANDDDDDSVISGDPRDEGAVLLWQTQSVDFVYTVSLSGDRRFCGFGGTSFMLVVLNGFTGAKLFTIPFSSTVWSVHIAQVGDATMIAVGGEFPTVSVINLETRETEVELPVDGEVSSVFISPISICYASGSCAFLYGAGGTECSWQDRPSFTAMTSMMATLANNEEMLLRCVDVILHRHPSIVNATPDPSTPELGPSLLHWAIETGSSSKLLASLLRARCSLGILPDSRGRTALSPALEQSKSAHIQLLVEALVSGRFSLLPEPMHAVATTFKQWAYRFPSDFLALIGSMSLQPEPEILGGRETQDITLTKMLIRGSAYRCPRDLWTADLDTHSMNDYDEHAETKAAATMPEGFCRLNTGGIQALRVPFAYFAGSDDVRFAPLQLILHAAAVTGEYSIFGTKLIKVLLEFKWGAFGQTIYMRQCVLKAIDLVLSLIYFRTATNHATLSLSELADEDSTFLVLSSFGWVWTTVIALVRDFPRAWEAVSKAYSKRQDGFKRLFKVLEAMAVTEPLATNIVMLCARCITPSSGATNSNWVSEDLLLVLHGLAIIVLSLRTCFSFRGFLRFGSLVHMVITVVGDIAPFLTLTTIVMIGFSLAIGLVASPLHDPVLEQHGFLSALATAFDMGLHATTIDPFVMHDPQIFLFYFPFMIMVQVILLNLLIAIMSDSTHRNIRGAAMVAQYQRARLIVDLEPRKLTAIPKRPSVRKGPNTSRFERLFSLSANFGNYFLKQGVSSEYPRPKWLHVLAPPDGKDEEVSTHTEQELAAIRRTLSVLQAEIAQSRSELPAAVEKQLRLSSVIIGPRPT